MLSKKNVITITIALTILLIVAMPLILYFTYFGLYLNNAFSKSQEIWGQFGDFISGIYAFFAFLGVLFAVYFQEKQLRTARTQLQLDELKKLISDLSTEIDLILNKELLIEANREATTSLNEININKVSSNQKVWSLREVLSAIGENAILNNKLDAEFKKVYDNIKLDVAQLLIEFKQFPKVFDQYIKVGGSEFITNFYIERYRYFVLYICKLKELDFTLDKADKLKETFRTEESSNRIIYEKQSSQVKKTDIGI